MKKKRYQGHRSSPQGGNKHTKCGVSETHEEDDKEAKKVEDDWWKMEETIKKITSGRSAKAWQVDPGSQEDFGKVVAVGRESASHIKKNQSREHVSQIESAAHVYGQAMNAVGEITQARILLDRGNLTKLGVASSNGFRKKRGVGLARVGGNQVETAGAALGMTQDRMSQPFDLEVSGLKPVLYAKKAIVIQELTDEINVGANSLPQEQGITRTSPRARFQAKGTPLDQGDKSEELIKKVIQCNSLEPDRGSGIKRRAASVRQKPRKRAKMGGARELGNPCVGGTRRPRAAGPEESLRPQAQP